MATHYIEFDTTQQALLADLRTQILVSTDWARIGSPDTVLLTTSAATAANATSLPFTATAGSGLAIGSVIAIDNGTLREYRTITNITATAITVAAMTFAHASGTQIRAGNEIYKATTTRGAQMVVDLADTHPATDRLALAVYRTHDGTTGVDKNLRYLYWRSGGGATSHALHVTLSLSKEHFFLSIEGPRAGEVGAASANYGSLRQYFFLCDLVPYDAGDTDPVVVVGGSAFPSADSAISNLSHMAAQSRNTIGQPWSSCRLLSLAFPSASSSVNINVMRHRDADDKFVMSPYVVFDDSLGMRGRLSHLFYAGNNMSDLVDPPPPPTGTKVEYQGAWYKLLAVNKSESSRDVYGVLGFAANAAGSTHQRSVVVAVPCLP